MQLELKQITPVLYSVRKGNDSIGAAYYNEFAKQYRFKVHGGFDLSMDDIEAIYAKLHKLNHEYQQKQKVQ